MLYLSLIHGSLCSIHWDIQHLSKRVSVQRFDQLWLFATDGMRSPSSQWVKTPKHGHCLVSCHQKAVKRRDGHFWHMFIHPLWKLPKMLIVEPLRVCFFFIFFFCIKIIWPQQCSGCVCASESSILWSSGSITCFDLLHSHSISSPVCLFRALVTEFYMIKLSEPPDPSWRLQLDCYLSAGVN